MPRAAMGGPAGWAEGLNNQRAMGDYFIVHTFGKDSLKTLEGLKQEGDNLVG